MLVLKAFGIWLLILGCAFLNGALREVVLIPKLGNPAALILSGVLLSACILVVSLLFAPRLGNLQVSHYWYIGLLWLLLTLSFEIGFGLLRQQSWSTILEAYTFKNGNIWPLVLAVTFLSPLVAGKLQGRI
jgi:hypothetical protein